MKYNILLIPAITFMTACSTPKGNMSNNEQTTEQLLVGAYTGYRQITNEEKVLFSKTYRGDAKLTPQKVSTQVVAGTNYSFICKDKEGNAYEVIIYQPLPGQGEAEITSVNKK